MRCETLDMRLLLTVPVQLPNPFRHLMTEEVFFHPPAPASGGEWQGGIPTERSEGEISNNTRMPPPLPSSDSGTELPFAKLLLLSAATFSSERRRNLSFRQFQTFLRWLKSTTITPLHLYTYKPINLYTY